MFGSNYVIDHVVAEHNIRVNEQNYKTYMSDVMFALARWAGIDVPYRFAEINDDNETEELSGDQIALEVIKRAGLKGKIDGD